MKCSRGVYWQDDIRGRSPTEAVSEALYGVLRFWDGPMFCIKLMKRRQDLNSIYWISLWVLFFYFWHNPFFLFVLLKTHPQQHVQNHAGLCLAGAHGEAACSPAGLILACILWFSIPPLTSLRLTFTRYERTFRPYPDHHPLKLLWTYWISTKQEWLKWSPFWQGHRRSQVTVKWCLR